ncbi:collagen alpha-1(I) chain-like [Falco peregrinus]|uniref:collagen alpha-1(I) chain-like n=1 Tax=Falco peregrinus TaxID=8954 RepID=UPI00247840E4|nr:collagen alpha-1(I) chain-like [Falco peregrinus]
MKKFKKNRENGGKKTLKHLLSQELHRLQKHCAAERRGGGTGKCGCGGGGGSRQSRWGRPRGGTGRTRRQGGEKGFPSSPRRGSRGSPRGCRRRAGTSQGGAGGPRASCAPPPCFAGQGRVPLPGALPPFPLGAAPGGTAVPVRSVPGCRGGCAGLVSARLKGAGRPGVTGLQGGASNAAPPPPRRPRGLPAARLPRGAISPLRSLQNRGRPFPPHPGRRGAGPVPPAPGAGVPAEGSAGGGGAVPPGALRAAPGVGAAGGRQHWRGARPGSAGPSAPPRPWGLGSPCLSLAPGDDATLKYFFCPSAGACVALQGAAARGPLQRARPNSDNVQTLVPGAAGALHHRYFS